MPRDSNSGTNVLAELDENEIRFAKETFSKFVQMLTPNLPALKVEAVQTRNWSSAFSWIDTSNEDFCERLIAARKPLASDRLFAIDTFEPSSASFSLEFAPEGLERLRTYYSGVPFLLTDREVSFVILCNMDFLDDVSVIAGKTGFVETFLARSLLEEEAQFRRFIFTQEYSPPTERSLKLQLDFQDQMIEYCLPLWKLAREQRK